HSPRPPQPQRHGQLRLAEKYRRGLRRARLPRHLRSRSVRAPHIYDYGIEADAPEQERKRESILAMLRRVRKEHVPIHALGVQSHLRPHGDPFSWHGLNTFLKEIRKLKMEVFVTELDVDDSALPADIPERDRLVAEVYR